jgi:hypothetical protein
MPPTPARGLPSRATADQLFSLSRPLFPPRRVTAPPRARPGVKGGEAAERSEGTLYPRASPVGSLVGRGAGRPFGRALRWRAPSRGVLKKIRDIWSPCQRLRLRTRVQRGVRFKMLKLHFKCSWFSDLQRQHTIVVALNH